VVFSMTSGQTNPTVCDYNDYDYRTQFWSKANRTYEHQSEVTMVRRLIQNWATQHTHICDAGCGFGRLIPAYENLFEQYHLVDYAASMLNQIDSRFTATSGYHRYQQSLYDITLPYPMDVIISIRTLHHLPDTERLLDHLYHQLSPNGILIMDIPNYYHIKQRLKRPFQKKLDRIKRSNQYYTYNTKKIIEIFKIKGFNIVCKRQMGLFRSHFLKKWVSPQWLMALDMVANWFFSQWDIGPSVYIVAKKCG
jgi:2-polyprenyl-3-methyl-5-hydroxy-6-metoxy-1,4-benzoquinol methylase